MPLLHTKKDPVAIGLRLKAARTERGLSQRQLAKATPYTAAYISRLESGARKATYDALRSFAAALGVSADWLEGGRAAATAAPPASGLEHGTFRVLPKEPACPHRHRMDLICHCQLVGVEA